MTDSKPIEDTLLAEKVTTVKKKDPKKVEAGKKLAAISKAAKEKKMRKMLEMEKSLSENNVGNVVFYTGIAISLLTVAGLLSSVVWKKDTTVTTNDIVKENNISKKSTVLENL